MAAIKSTNTTAERRLRSALHARGVRYRLGQVVITHDRKVRPDIVFKMARLAVFVDGCFWHGCQEHCRRPGSNSDYWAAKIDRNSKRDHVIDAALEADGWTVMRFWEHQDPSDAALVVEQFLRSLRRPAFQHRPVTEQRTIGISVVGKHASIN
jgi:DNA mismatch endonuclease, patch repair protein